MKRQLHMMATIIIGGILLTGCTGQDDYAKANACRVPATLVADVLGNKAFTTDENSASLPVDGNDAINPGSYVCRVDVDGERMFSVEIAVESQNTLDVRRTAIAKSPNRFTTGEGKDEGEGKVDTPDSDGDDTDLYAMWICGDVGIMLEGETKEQASVKDVTTLMKAWADKAGCWSQEKFPADTSTS